MARKKALAKKARQDPTSAVPEASRGVVGAAPGAIGEAQMMVVPTGKQAVEDAPGAPTAGAATPQAEAAVTLLEQVARVKATATPQDEVAQTEVAATSQVEAMRPELSNAQAEVNVAGK